jgi:hypothetical protein
VDFATDGDREEATDKLTQKRAALEKTARQLAAAGVEYSVADLPRSFRAQGEAKQEQPS